MANTYTRLYIQIVFAVKGRANLIKPMYREELHRYLTGIVQKRSHKLLAVFCMPDHVHLPVGLRPSQSIADLVRDIKAGSSNFINEKKWLAGKFSWQEGYGAFSYAHSQLDEVIRYILGQEKHYQKLTFREEYLAFLKKFKVEYDHQFLFEWIE